VWKPLDHPVEDAPLALCDGSSFDTADLVLCDHVTGQEHRETTYMRRRSQHRWYYLSNQRPEEVVLFKNFDSATNVAAQCEIVIPIWFVLRRLTLC
jgi:hypothetical protein